MKIIVLALTFKNDSVYLILNEENNIYKQFSIWTYVFLKNILNECMFLTMTLYELRNKHYINTLIDIQTHCYFLLEWIMLKKKSEKGGQKQNKNPKVWNKRKANLIHSLL